MKAAVGSEENTSLRHTGMWDVGESVTSPRKNNMEVVPTQGLSDEI